MGAETGDLFERKTPKPEMEAAPEPKTKSALLLEAGAFVLEGGTPVKITGKISRGEEFFVTLENGEHRTWDRTDEIDVP